MVNVDNNNLRPNIIFILADDLGYADLSIYGQTDYQTPHLDKLASQGVRFTQAYANSAICSATRFALITGRYQYRLRGGLEEPIARSGKNLGLPPEHPTLPSLLKKVGYHTALIGKWHLGRPPEYSPQKSGYDKFFGNLGGVLDYFTHKPGVGENVPKDLYEGNVPIERTGYYTNILADEAVAYMEDRVKHQQPFFMSLHFTAPHWPWQGPNDEHVSKELKDLFHYDGGNLKTYAKIVQALDQAVGDVMQSLDTLGLSDNTIVIFTSDNGGERFSKTWPFVGQKTELLEGGLRVPALMRWPNVIKPQLQDQVTMTIDWVPTLIEAAEAEIDPEYPSDGISILPILKGTKPSHDRVLYWRYKSQNQRAVRDGNWKYLKINDNEFLFNVFEDQRERANLKNKYPEVFSRLKASWDSWNKDFLPITDDIYSHGLSPDIQADRYVPTNLNR